MDKKDSKNPLQNTSKSTSWGGVAGWYDELLEESSDSFQAKVILPNLSRILDLKPGMKVLDIACGQGFFARTFEQAGAEVSAADISPELIVLAKKKSPASTAGKPAIAYHVAAADSMPFAADGSFDAAVIVLAVQNIENIQGALAESARILRKGGRLVLVLNHPAFRIPKESSWEWDEKTGKQFRRIDSYLSDAKIKIDMTPGELDPMKKKSTISFHRPLQSYFKSLNKAGFVVSRLEEWISHRKSQKGPRAIEEDRLRKEIPMFLMLEATKA